MSSPPQPKLRARASKVKGIKSLEKVCDHIHDNANWQGINNDIQVLLDATRALEVLHQRYRDNYMNEIGCNNSRFVRMLQDQKRLNGEEDDLASMAWETLTSSWMTILLTYPELFTKKIANELDQIDTGDFDGNLQCPCCVTLFLLIERSQ